MWRLGLQLVPSSFYLHVGADWIMLHVNRKGLQPGVGWELWWEVWWGRVGRRRGETAAAPRSSTLGCSTMEKQNDCFLICELCRLAESTLTSQLPLPPQSNKQNGQRLMCRTRGRTPQCTKCRAARHSQSHRTGSTGRAYGSMRTPHSHSADEGLKEKNEGKGGGKIAASQERREDKAEQRKTHWKKKLRKTCIVKKLKYMNWNTKTYQKAQVRKKPSLACRTQTNTETKQKKTT